MPTERQSPRREPRINASFHDMAAQELYVSRFRAIGISAVAAGVRARKTTRATPPHRDIPAILLHGPEVD